MTSPEGATHVHSYAKTYSPVFSTESREDSGPRFLTSLVAYTAAVCKKMHDLVDFHRGGMEDHIHSAFPAASCMALAML